PELRAVRSLRERVVISMNVFRVGELAGRTNDPAKKLERCRNPIRRRQMIHELGRNPRILKMLLDEFGVFLVDRLRRRLCRDMKRRPADRGQEQHHAKELQLASHFAMVFLSQASWPPGLSCPPACPERAQRVEGPFLP